MRAHTGALRGGDEVVGRPALPRVEPVGAVRLRLHRVDQEVGDVDALQRLVEPRPGGDVTLDDRHVGLDLRRRAGERAHVVPVAQKARDQRGSDEAAGSGDEGPHRSEGYGSRDAGACPPTSIATAMEVIRRLEAQARERLDEATFGYFAGGAADEVTMASNERAWSRWDLRPRVLTGCAQADPAADVLAGRPPCRSCSRPWRPSACCIPTAKSPRLAPPRRRGRCTAWRRAPPPTWPRSPRRRRAPGCGSSSTRVRTATRPPGSSRAPPSTATRRWCSPSTSRSQDGVSGSTPRARSRYR